MATKGNIGSIHNDRLFFLKRLTNFEIEDIFKYCSLHFQQNERFNCNRILLESIHLNRKYLTISGLVFSELADFCFGKRTPTHNEIHLLFLSFFAA